MLRSFRTWGVDITHSESRDYQGLFRRESRFLLALDRPPHRGVVENGSKSNRQIKSASGAVAGGGCMCWDKLSERHRLTGCEGWTESPCKGGSQSEICHPGTMPFELNACEAVFFAFSGQSCTTCRTQRPLTASSGCQRLLRSVAGETAQPFCTEPRMSYSRMMPLAASYSSRPSSIREKKASASFSLSMISMTPSSLVAREVVSPLHSNFPVSSLYRPVRVYSV